MKKHATIILTFVMLCLFMPPAHAEYAPAPAVKKELSLADRMALARQFVSKIKQGFASADKKMGGQEMADREAIARLPDGEELLFRLRLNKRFWMDTPVYGKTDKGRVLVSLMDFVAGLELPITVTPAEGKAEGWYIRENKQFMLDVKTRQVQTDNGVFQLSDGVLADENDILVPYEELAKWFNFELSMDMAALEFLVETPIPLPILAKLERGKRQFGNNRTGPAQLPPLEGDESKLIGMPFVDVSSRMSYEKDGITKESRNRATSSIRTTGDFANGVLDTQTQLEKEQKLTSFRATYRKESLENDLLGPLKARKFELGDVISPYMPIKNVSGQGLGARVSNVNPLRGTLGASTEIRGTTFPGWDVELYRNGGLVSYTSVDDTGQYVFRDVDLYGTDNNFKVVLYGPQGEIREEEISVPVDTRRLSDSGGVYDVSVTAQGSQTYRKFESQDEDDNAPHLTALYELPVGKQTALTAGIDTGQEDGERTGTAYAGISTPIAGFLTNLNTAVEQDGEAGVEMVVRRDINGHQFRNEVNVATPGFNQPEAKPGEEETETDPFKNEFTINGPLPLNLGLNPQYGLGFTYAMEADGDNRIDLTPGISTNIAGVGVNQQFVYSSGGEEEDQLDSLTSVSGLIGQNNVRLLANYQIKPDSQLENVVANVRRSITPKADIEFNLEHRLEPKLTEGRTQVNWKTGYGTVSPSLSYNSDRDMIAMLSTRFGAAHEPFTKGAKLFDQNITSNGGVSALVFLDKDGNNIYDGEDELLPDVMVLAPQNHQRVKTDEKGVAFFHRLAKFKPTDIMIDSETLSDPFWIAGYEGASVIPREGHVSTLTFPVHMAGEIDGTVYARGEEGSSIPLRGVPLSLYNHDGKKVMTAITESDGFYLLSKVPPGDYYLNIDAESLKKDYGRPMPQPVHIAFDGTTMYGNNIYLEPGQSDIPIKFLAGADFLTEEDKAALETQTVYLNLGTYKSRLMMGLAWFKLRSLHGSALKDVALLEKPSESFPDAKTNTYVLRALVRNNNFDTAYAKCRSIADSDQPCSVEVLPGGYKNRIASQSVQPKG